MKIILGFDTSLLDKVLNKFNNLIEGDLQYEKDGYAVFLKELITIDDLQSISDKWMYVEVDVLNQNKYIIKSPDGEIEVGEETFPIVKATGQFSRLNDLNIKEQPILFQAYFKECMESSDTKITFSILYM